MKQSTAATKKATNITLSADVLAEAKALKLNISQTCESYLRAEIGRLRGEKWRQKHQAYLQAYNRIVEENGLPLDEYRQF